MDSFLPLIYAIGQLEYVPQPWYLKIDFDQFINIPMLYNNLESEISDVLPLLYAITGCNTTSYKCNFGKIRGLKKFIRISSSSL